MAQATRYNEPFYFHRIVNVGWASGLIAVATIEFNENSDKSVLSFDPADGLVENLVAPAGEIIPSDNYKTKQIVRLSVDGDLGRELTELEYTSLVGAASVESGGGASDPHYIDEVNAFTAALGRPPDRTTDNGIFSPTTTTLHNPDGTTITYITGWNVITFIPPDFDFTGWASSLWIDTIDHDAQYANTVRRSWLVNFTNRPREGDAPAVPYVKTADVHSTPGGLPYESQYSIRLYPISAELTMNADGSVSSNRAPVYSRSGTADNTADGIVQKFDRTGFVS